MAIDNHKKSFVMNTLRRGTYRWPGRWIAEKRSALGKGFYYCENEMCGVVVKKNQTQMDHIIPVILTSGFDSWEGVLDRMYPSPEGWARLCKDCHGAKTLAEGQVRKEKRHAKKNSTK